VAVVCAASRVCALSRPRPRAGHGLAPPWAALGWVVVPALTCVRVIAAACAPRWILGPGENVSPAPLSIYVYYVVRALSGLMNSVAVGVAYVAVGCATRHPGECHY
jgi:hypothetical protein